MMKQVAPRSAAWLSCLALSTPIWAAAPALSAVDSPAAEPAKPGATTLDAVAARIKGAKAGDLRTTPIPGIYEYRRGAELAYVTADGRYAFAGDLYQLSDNSNLSDTRRRELRRTLVAAVPEANMLVYSPEEPKYTVTVFTDVDCSYCRALHKQIAEYNRLGIRVRYLSYPRGGPNTESWTRAEQVWCAQDRKATLTRAKLGEDLTGKTCSPNPVAEEYALGKAIGLEGTPGIVTESGKLLAGYLPPAALLDELKEDARDTKR
jgi:thiol:disulfide interchange protein DsbC